MFKNILLQKLSNSIKALSQDLDNLDEEQLFVLEKLLETYRSQKWPR